MKLAQTGYITFIDPTPQKVEKKKIKLQQKKEEISEKEHFQSHFDEFIPFKRSNYAHTYEIELK